MTIDTTTNAGRVRSLTGDMDESNPLSSDAEITAFLALAGDNVFSAAALACRSIAAKAARGAFSITIMAGQFSLDKSTIPNRYLALADKYDKMADEADTGDYFVDGWHLHLNPTDGQDDGTYPDDEDDDEPAYHDVHVDNAE